MSYNSSRVEDEDESALFDDLIDPSKEGDLNDDNGFMFDPIGSQFGDDPDEDEFEEGEDTPLEEGTGDPIEDSEEEDTPRVQGGGGESQIIEDILKSKGIIDSSKIQFENDKGEIEELDFYDLTYEEQLNILAESINNHDLDDNEVQTIEFLRQNNVTLEQAIEYFQNEAVENYKKEQRGESLQIDSLSDEEIFVMDLQATYDDLTEKDLIDILNHELENEGLFKRKVDRLRKEYREAEEKQLEEADRATKEAKEIAQRKLHEGVAEVATKVEDIGGIDLHDNDKDEVLKFIVEKDINNKSELEKAMESPEELFRIAWFLSKGEEAFDILHSYYRNEIDNARKTATKKKEDTPNNANKQGLRRNQEAVVAPQRRERTTRSSFEEDLTEDDIVQDLYGRRK